MRISVTGEAETCKPLVAHWVARRYSGVTIVPEGEPSDLRLACLHELAPEPADLPPETVPLRVPTMMPTLAWCKTPRLDAVLAKQLDPVLQMFGCAVVERRATWQYRIEDSHGRHLASVVGANAAEALGYFLEEGVVASGKVEWIRWLPRGRLIVQVQVGGLSQIYVARKED
jgi:hypothetical protein